MYSPTRAKTGLSLPRASRGTPPTPPPDPRATEDGIITKLSVFPKPYQKPHPQLWGTVSSPNSLKQTAELGFNAVTWRPSVLQIREWCETYASIRSEREGREFALGEGWAVQRNTYVADSMEEAKDDAEEAFLRAHGFVSSFHTDVSQSLRFYMNPGEKPTPDMKLDWDLLNERQFLAGPPGHVAEKVHELQEVCGINHLLTNFPGGGGIPHNKVMRSLELFGTKGHAAVQERGQGYHAYCRGITIAPQTPLILEEVHLAAQKKQSRAYASHIPHR